MTRFPVFLFLLCLTVGPVLAQTFYVVRHAEKDLTMLDNPPLTPEGRSRADRLKNRLETQNIKSIFSTQTKRTYATVLPLATKLNLPILLYSGSDQTQFIDSLKTLSGNAVIVGHSNTMHHVINGLAEKPVLQGPLDEAIYNRIYEVTRRKVGKPKVKVIEF